MDLDAPPEGGTAPERGGGDASCSECPGEMDMQLQSSDDGEELTPEQQKDIDELLGQHYPNEEQRDFVWGMLYYAESKKGAAHRDWLLKKMTRTGEQRDSTQREAAERMDALIVEVDDATEALKKADKEAEDYIEKGKELEAAMAANKKKIQETVAAAKQRKKELSEKAKMLEVTLREVAGGSKARLTCDTANKAIAAKSPSVAQPEKVAPRYVGALMRGPMGPPRGPAGQGWRPQPARTVEPATDKEVCEMEAKFPIPAYVKEGDRAALLAVTGIPGGILIR